MTPNEPLQRHTEISLHSPKTSPLPLLSPLPNDEHTAIPPVQKVGPRLAPQPHHPGDEQQRRIQRHLARKRQHEAEPDVGAAVGRGKERGDADDEGEADAGEGGGEEEGGAVGVAETVHGF